MVSNWNKHKTHRLNVTVFDPLKNIFDHYYFFNMHTKKTHDYGMDIRNVWRMYHEKKTAWKTIKYKILLWTPIAITKIVCFCFLIDFFFNFGIFCEKYQCFSWNLLSICFWLNHQTEPFDSQCFCTAHRPNKTKQIKNNSM